MIRQRLAAIFVTIAAVQLLASCGERPTSAELGKGPSFFLRGSGRLASFRIYGPQPGHKIGTPFDENSLVWCVQSSQGYFKGSPVSQLTVEYGIIPENYVQRIPIGSLATPLRPGSVYYFFAETTDAPPAAGFFYLDENLPMEINIPDLCETGFTGEVKPIKCDNKEPYTEPADLKRFALEHRVQK